MTYKVHEGGIVIRPVTSGPPSQNNRKRYSVFI